METIIKNKKHSYDLMPYPKWKRLGLSMEPEIISNNKPTISVIKPDVWKDVRLNKITCSQSDLLDIYYNPYDAELREFEALNHGCDIKYVYEGETAFNAGLIIRLDEERKLDEPLIIEYNIDDNTPYLVDHHYIHVKRNASAHIIIKYSGNTSEDLAKGYHNGVTKIYVEEGASLKLTKLQFFGENVYHIDNNVSVINHNGYVEFSSIDLGSKSMASKYLAYLAGSDAKSDTVTAYLGKGDQKLDIGYESIHQGVRSESLIDCHGALLDHAKKIFRGNLKFKRGGYKSVGKEAEYVLLLDKDVHSDAIPALLCDEDDVVGEHAASAGQLDEDQLFYLMSRGFSEKEAKKVIVHGFFSKVIDLIPIQGLKDEVEERLERSLVDERES